MGFFISLLVRPALPTVLLFETDIRPVARLFYWEVRSKEEAVLLSCHRKQQIFYTMLKDKGLLKKRTMFIFISFKQKSWVQHVKTRAPVAAPPPLPTGGGYPFTLLVKFKLWNLIIFMLSIVFQQLSRNLPMFVFVFAKKLTSITLAIILKRVSSQGRRGIVCKVPSITS